MDHTIDLIQKSHEGDEEARARLVEENAGLVWCIVKRFHNRGVETEDLFQIGNIGLIKAIDKFDLSYDVKFSTYAVPMISGEIKRFLRDDGMIKVSRSLKELAYKAYLLKEDLQNQWGREPTVGEISERGIFVGCWAMALAEMLNVFPIFIRRMKIIKSVPYLILGIAVGKTVGALLFFANHWGQ